MSSELIRKTAAMKTWAVVGAHDDPSRFGHRIFRHLLDLGYSVYPIHPRLKEIDGHQVYKSIADLPETPDVVDMVVNPETGLKVMEQIKARGIRYVWMQPGTRSEAIREFAAASGIELIEDCVLVQLG
ncbi:MAG TPA: CoA-binding protein [Candidatus Sumerlaeota bacterium]|nr:CoA-binding protein [Candidatus Sumerlaeota bacterium]